MCLIPIKRYRWALKVLLGLATCLTVCFAVLPATVIKADASPGLDLTVVSGFDGKCKLGGLNPVVVIVEAKESGYSGLLKVKAGERTYSCRIELASGSRKEVRFTIPFFRANDRIEVVFESGGQVLADAVSTPEILPERTIFIGGVSDSPQNLYYLKEMDTSELGGGKVEIVSLGGDLNYSLAELENMNLIVIEDSRKVNFSERAAKLLQEWVKSGNCLLIVAGESPPAAFAGIIKDLSRPASLGDGIIVPVDGGVLAKSPQFVQGIILKHVTPYAVAKAVNGSGLPKQIKGAGNLNGVADNTLRPDKNTMHFILSFLVLYMFTALVAAFSVKRLKWVYAALVGASCLVFLVLSLTSGIFKPAAAGAAVRVHGTATRTYALTCIYPYGEDEVRVKSPGAFFTSALDGGGWESDPSSGEVKYSGKTGKYIYTSSLDLNGAEDSALVADSSGILSGELKNPLPDKLENCFIIFGDTVIPVGDLAGREKISLNYRLDYNLRGSGDYNYLAALCRAAGTQGLRRQMVDYYFYNVDDWQTGGRLIGFSSETGDLEINGNRQKTKYTVLNVFNIAVAEASQELFLPGETIRPVVDYGPGSAGSEGTGKREYPGEEGREMKVYFVLPPGLKSFEISITGTPGRAGESVRVYSRNSKAWDEVKGGTLAGEKLQDCVSGGPLILKISGGGRTGIPQIAVKGATE
jgi:hypothetical protein